MLKILILMIATLMLGQGQAQSSEKNSLAIQKYFGQVPCHGQGTVYKFVIPAYDIGLWVKEGQSWSYDQPFALEVKARWNVDKKEMLDSTLEVMKRNTVLTLAQEKEYTDFLHSFYPDLKEKDLVTVVFIPQQKILFYHNNKLLKESTNMTFARAFCDIWLSPKTKYDSARRAMLGLD
ncbi:MAG: chalcone isomerase family protein [Alphaproteobacteria bacterium]